MTAEAVRKCTEAEEREGWESGRVIGCRWVLTWKDVPPEDRQHAADDATNNDQTPFTPSGDRKSKARIVHLGYQHPDLLKPEFRSSAQIQATISRYLTFALTVQNQWRIEGLDLSTAFLQTEKNQESQRLWTQLARELRQALGVSDGGLLRILKDSYGSTTAPRGLWRDIDRNLQKLGASLELTKSWAILVCGYGHNQIHALSIPWTSTRSLAIWQVTWMISIEVAMMKIHFGSRSRMRSTSFIDGEQQRQVSIDMSAVTLR